MIYTKSDWFISLLRHSEESVYTMRKKAHLKVAILDFWLNDEQLRYSSKSRSQLPQIFLQNTWRLILNVQHPPSGRSHGLRLNSKQVFL